MSRHQITGQNNMKVADKSLENVAELKYFEVCVTNQRCIHKEINGRVNLGYAGRNFLSSRQLSKNVKIKIYMEL
jgi:hypothetical protein